MHQDNLTEVAVLEVLKEASETDLLGRSNRPLADSRPVGPTLDTPSKATDPRTRRLGNPPEDVGPVGSASERR